MNKNYCMYFFLRRTVVLIMPFLGSLFFSTEILADACTAYNKQYQCTSSYRQLDPTHQCRPHSINVWCGQNDSQKAVQTQAAYQCTLALPGDQKFMKDCYCVFDSNCTPM